MSEQEARDKGQRELSGNEGEEETNATSPKKRRKAKGSRCEEDEDERSKASGVETPGQRRKSRKPYSCESPVTKPRLCPPTGPSIRTFTPPH